MADMESIRLLKADEIECRVSTINKHGLSLLLFKDARVDQKILDETFTPFGWKRSHQSIDGNLYCTVEVWDAVKDQWISKQDVGSGNSSYSEKEKGTASDSFKRACFNWGIGRELYTAPFIWISAGKAAIGQRDGRFYTRDRFSVESIRYGEDRNITGLTIMNESGTRVYMMQKQRLSGSAETKNQEVSTSETCSERAENVSVQKAARAGKKTTISQRQMAALNKELERTGVPLEAVLGRYRLDNPGSMTADIYAKAMDCLRRSKNKVA
ncbi:MAG: hypothetical protein LUC94_14990 [Clostridiales bacterium]|nr:hypothetical protein [Clostridiales bacterium]